MKMRKMLSALVLAAGAVAAGGIAQADVYVYDTTVTPPEVVNVIPSNGYGEAYAPGYHGAYRPSHYQAYPAGHYVWDGTRYVWMSDRVASVDDARKYDRWSFVPDDYVGAPQAFEQPKEHGG